MFTLKVIAQTGATNEAVPIGSAQSPLAVLDGRDGRGWTFG